jgi:hypothetical protein
MVLRHRINEVIRPDVMVIGFQEIVPLTAQQIVQADPEKKFVFLFYYLDLLPDPVADAFGKTKSLRPSNDDRIKSPTTSFCAANRYLTILTIQSSGMQAHSIVG